MATVSGDVFISTTVLVLVQQKNGMVRRSVRAVCGKPRFPYFRFLFDEARHRQLCDAELVASTAPTAADESAMFPPRFAEMAHAMMAIRRFPFAGLTSLLPRRACRLLQGSAKRVRPARWHALTLSLGKSASDANGSASSASLLRRSRERR